MLASGKILRGKAFVVGDDVNTDDVIEAQYGKLDFTKPDQYTELGRHAMERYAGAGGARLVEPGQDTSQYRFVIAGRNFGIGSSREQAPAALGAAGVKVVVAGSFAPIYFKNSAKGGFLKSRRCKVYLPSEMQTGDELELDMGASVLITKRTGKTYPLEKPPKELELLEEMGLVEYALRNWM